MRIRVIDLETTGMEPPDAAICEIGFCDVLSTAIDNDGRPTNWVVHEPQSTLINPHRPIPPEVSAIHHIIDADVAQAPSLEVMGPVTFGAAVVDVFAAHQAKFERSFIPDTMTLGKPWICTYKCALRIWKDAPSHSNQALRYWRNPVGLDRAVANVAHRAGPDAYVTAFHLRDMLNGGALVEHLVKRSTQPALQVTCHIGDQWRGKKWADVDPGFLRWLLGKDFDEDVKFTAQHWLDERTRAAAAERSGQDTA